MYSQQQRMERLKQFLEENPRDILSLYAMAMEFQSLGELEQATAFLDRVLAVDAGHAASYFQKASILIKLGRIDQARATLTAGIPKAIEGGFLHSRDKMQELLKQIGK